MNPRQQTLIAAAVAVLVAVLFFMFALRPKLDQIGETRDEVEAAEQTELRLQDQLQDLEEAREQRPRTIARLAVANRFVPVEADLPGFIRLMQSAANGSGVDLESISPGQPTDLEGGNGVQAIDVTLVVRGGFRRIEDFLIRLETLERLVEVRSLSISPEEEELSDQVTLATTIALQMYVAAPDASFSGGTS